MERTTLPAAATAAAAHGGDPAAAKAASSSAAAAAAAGVGVIHSLTPHKVKPSLDCLTSHDQCLTVYTTDVCTFGEVPLKSITNKQMCLDKRETLPLGDAMAGRRWLHVELG